MKNSKFLSLLTAAALVVSSFSGLAMNGGAAKAIALSLGNFPVATGAFGNANTGGTKTDAVTLERGEIFEVVVPVTGGDNSTKIKVTTSGTTLEAGGDWAKKDTNGDPIWDNGFKLSVTVPATAPLGHVETVTVGAYTVSAAGIETLNDTNTLTVTVVDVESSPVTLTDSSVTLGGNGKTTAEVSISEFAPTVAGYVIDKATITIDQLYASGDWANATDGWTVKATSAASAADFVDATTRHKALGTTPSKQVTVSITGPDNVKADKTATLYVHVTANVIPTKDRVDEQMAQNPAYDPTTDIVPVVGVATLSIKIAKNTKINNEIYLSETYVAKHDYTMEVDSTDQTIYEVSAFVSSPDDASYKPENVKYTWRTTNADDFTVLDSANSEKKKILTQEEISEDTTTYKFYVSDEAYAGDAYIWCTAVVDGVTKVGPAKLTVTVNPSGSVNATIDKDTIVMGSTDASAAKATATLTKTNGAKDKIVSYLVVASGGDVDFSNATPVPGKDATDVPRAGLRAIGSDSNTLDFEIIGKTGANYYDVYLFDEAGRYGTVSFLATYEGAIAPTAINLSSSDVVITTIGSTVSFMAEVTPNETDAKGLKTKNSVTIEDVKVEVADPAIAEITAIQVGTGYDKFTNGQKGWGETTSQITVRGLKAGTTKMTVYAYGDLSVKAELNVTVSGDAPEPTPTPTEHKAGDVFSADGYTVEVLADLTVAIQDAPVVGKNVTIPEKVDGLTVSAIDEKAFKGSSAKKVYVEGAVAELGKAAFKKSKVKKVFFYQPAALTTVDKNAFAKTNAKVVAVGGSFSKDVAKQLEKAGAKSVKNNGTAK